MGYQLLEYPGFFNFSLTTFLTTIFFGSILVILLYLFCNIDSWFYATHYKFFFYCTFLIIIRLLLPFETRFTITILVEHVLPDVYDFFRYQLGTFGGFDFCLYHLLLIIWILGSCFFAIRYLTAYIHFTRILHYLPKIEMIDLDNLDLTKYIISNTASSLRVIQTKYINTPSITGLFKPTVLLPNINFTDSELKLIFSHELQHFKSHDMLFKFFLELLCTLYWWNPIVFLLKRQIGNLMELRVDAKLSKEWNELQRTEYLECLLKAYKYQTNTPTLKLAVTLVNRNEQFILKRAHYFLNEQKKSPPVFLTALVLSVLVISTFFIFEPHYTQSPDDGSFTLSPDSYIIKFTETNTYALYMDGEFLFETSDPYSDSYKGIPIYVH